MKTLALDKRYHIAAGFLVAVAVAIITGSAHVGFVASIVAGLGKEYGYDALMNRRAVAKGEVPPHSVEWQDACATVVGGALVYVLAIPFF